MRKPTALDASALIALVLGESGSVEVERVISSSVISAVNWSEVLQVLGRRVESAPHWAERLSSVNLEIRGFDVEDAEMAADLGRDTKKLGLSLADRACLALGVRYGCEVVTADKSWSGLQLGFPITVIR
jgi:PIN domain nuclease of toxin-antitoxin system